MKKYFAIIIIFVLYLIPAGQISAAETEISLSYGEDVPYDSWCSKGIKTYKLEFELKTSVKRWVDINWLDVGIVINRVWSDVNPGQVIDGVHFNGRTDSLITALRLTARKTLYKNIFVEGYGSLGIMIQNKHPEIGSDPDICGLATVGNFGGNIGYNFDSFNVIYGVGHWSNYLTKSDKGPNHHYIGIRIPLSHFSNLF